MGRARREQVGSRSAEGGHPSANRHQSHVTRTVPNHGCTSEGAVLRAVIGRCHGGDFMAAMVHIPDAWRACLLEWVISGLGLPFT
jgi:hypothetical protein